jgi:energy-coupling factor transporter transmembrane protein EcfT
VLFRSTPERAASVSLGLSERTAAVPRPRRALRLDPRTTALLVLAAGLVVMTPGGESFIPAALTLGVLLAVSEGAWRRALALPLTAAAIAAMAYLLPQAMPHPAVGIVATTAAFLLRFVAVGGIALHLLRTTPPTEFTAALRAARIPRAITVSAAVMLRFVPTIITEARAVHDAMRLRGVGGWGGLLRHPVLSIERFTVLRGLGSASRPTAMYPPRLGATDLAAALVVAALTAATVLW